MHVKSHIESIKMQDVLEAGPFQAFDERVVNFLETLSAAILGHDKARKFPDLAAFGFFIRRANLNKMRAEKVGLPNNVRFGLGLAFHVAPSNVPLNFAYSFVTALICGNPSIVRISSSHFPQAEILIDLINEIIPCSKFGPWLSIIHYPRESDLNEMLSSLCRIRLIWGGDETIAVFKKFKVKPNLIDITFPDKYSICVIDTSYYLSKSDPAKVASRFFDDVYTFDQNACTSPRAIVWLDNDVNLKYAQDLFWSSLEKEIEAKGYTAAQGAGVRKVSKASLHAALNLVEIDRNSTLATKSVINLKYASTKIFNNHPGEGIFYQLVVSEIQNLNGLIAENCQTLSIVGNIREEIVSWIMGSNLNGIDRICSVGSASNFTIDWDGKDLFSMMTKSFVI